MPFWTLREKDETRAVYEKIYEDEGLRTNEDPLVYIGEKVMTTNHEMRMEALRLFEENQSLHTKNEALSLLNQSLHTENKLMRAEIERLRAAIRSYENDRLASRLRGIGSPCIKGIPA